MAELKPCPFCGARGDLDHCAARDGVRQFFWVECRGDECGISGRICDTAEAAAAAWDRRAAPGVALPADTSHLNCLEARRIDRAYAICEPCNTGFPERCLYKRPAGGVPACDPTQPKGGA